MGLISAEDMKVLNDENNSEFYLAVCSGNVEKAESILKKNQGLAKIEMQNGTLPIRIAASCGRERMLQYLYDNTTIDLKQEQKIQLFFATIKTSMYGNETYLFSLFFFSFFQNH